MVNKSFIYKKNDRWIGSQMDGWVDLFLYFLFFVKVEDNDYFKYSYVYMG